jgi:hypothetical protein
MQPMPLRGPKIAGILETYFVPTLAPIYRAARLMGKPLGRPSLANFTSPYARHTSLAKFAEIVYPLCIYAREIMYENSNPKVGQ